MRDSLKTSKQLLFNHTNGAMGEIKANGVHDGVEHEKVALKKRVGLVSGVALIVGTMIGSGIFISPKGVLLGTGSVGLSMIVWLGCGIISICGALSYAELGTMIVKSGAEYSYILEASQCLPGWLAPIPAYLFAWVSVLVLKPALFAVIALSFGTYTVEPFFSGCDPPAGLVKLVSMWCLLAVAFINCYSVDLATKVQNFFTFAKLLAVAVITVGGLVKYVEVTVTLVNCTSVKFATTVQTFFTFAKLAALFMIIIGGFVKLGQGNTEYLENGFEGTSKSASGIALAFYDGLWAYDGWNNLNYVTEELKNPYVNLPRSIIIAIPLVTICYLLTNISYFSVMSKTELLASDAVAATWGSRVLGVASVIIPIAVACSTFGAANGSCFTGGRLVYAAAREGHLPEILSYVHVKQYTPLPSLLFTSFIALMMIIPGDIFTLIDFFSFTAWLFYGATMAAVIVLRFTKKTEHRPYKVPIVLPIFVLLCSVYLIIGPIVENPQIEFLYAFLFVISGLIFYVPFVHFKLTMPGMDKLTTFLQLILQVAPSKYAPPE